MSIPGEIVRDSVRNTSPPLIPSRCQTRPPGTVWPEQPAPPEAEHGERVAGFDSISHGHDNTFHDHDTVSPDKEAVEAEQELKPENNENNKRLRRSPQISPSESDKEPTASKVPASSSHLSEEEEPTSSSLSEEEEPTLSSLSKAEESSSSSLSKEEELEPHKVIPKPHGNVGRPGRGGYTLKRELDKLGWTTWTYNDVLEYIRSLAEKFLDTSVCFVKQDKDKVAKDRRQGISLFCSVMKGIGLQKICCKLI
ncbi:hypothetical protein K439DRAFT_1616409 [Ramaria rubella]|nr:hypothetical protein K439DRAFT_1616409 [Ramaria rubella]